MKKYIFIRNGNLSTDQRLVIGSIYFGKIIGEFLEIISGVDMEGYSAKGRQYYSDRFIDADLLVVTNYLFD